MSNRKGKQGHYATSLKESDQFSQSLGFFLTGNVTDELGLPFEL